MLRIETGLLLLAIIISFAWPSLGSPWFSAVERQLSRISRRPLLSIIVVGAATLVLRAAVLPVFPIPEPIVHDEFGYLLAADTFAHGRLTNPTHRMWVHFETFSILQKPTYQCFAQPAQGMILALGKVVFGHPFWGVWLSVGLMCAAITWMLQGWLPPKWALLGGLLAMLRYGVLSNWGNSYWGGALGAIGGALVIGALPRIKAHQRVRDALWIALGLAILANNRPYEGVVLSVPVAVILCAWLFGKNQPPLKTSMQKVILPLALALTIAAVGTCYYFWRVTGSPFRMPYQIERQTYGVAPYLVWQHVRPVPVYNHAAMQKMYTGEELLGYHIFLSPVGMLLKLYLFWTFYLGPALSLPFVMLLYSLPRSFSSRMIPPHTRVLLAIAAIFTCGVALESFYNTRYSAPATGIVLAFILLAMQNLRKWSPAGLFLSRAIPLICILTFGLRLSAGALRIPLSEYYEFAWHQKGAGSFGRAAIQDKLENMPGQHLVLVHYAPSHEPFAEWVYNEANIDLSKIVWGREMDSRENNRLIQYFKGRRVWLLDADANPPKLQPLKWEGGGTDSIQSSP
jgi:hypothetical protein